MIIVTLTRSKESKQTPGVLTVRRPLFSTYSCFTLELPWLNNKLNASCIPEGTYTVVKEFSTKFGNHFRLLNVPDRSDILIHSGNYATGKKKDTSGCILVGSHFRDLNHDTDMDIADSVKTLNSLFEMLPHSFKMTIVSLCL